MLLSTFYHPRISCLLEYWWVQLFSHLWINILESMFSHHLLFGGYYVASECEECVVACMREFFLNSWLLKLNRILTSNVGFFSFLSFFLQVDRSVIECFVQGGRMSMNTRSYPTVAYGSNAYVYLFNNGTTPINLRSLEVWQMHSASNDESIWSGCSNS